MSKKHKAVMLIKIDIHEVEGNLCGNCVDPHKYEEYNIKREQIISIDGEDLHSCLMKVKNFLGSNNEQT